MISRRVLLNIKGDKDRYYPSSIELPTDVGLAEIRNGFWVSDVWEYVVFTFPSHFWIAPASIVGMERTEAEDEKNKEGNKEESK